MTDHRVDLFRWMALARASDERMALLYRQGGKRYRAALRNLQPDDDVVLRSDEEMKPAEPAAEAQPAPTQCEAKPEAATAEPGPEAAEPAAASGHTPSEHDAATKDEEDEPAKPADKKASGSPPAKKKKARKR